MGSILADAGINIGDFRLGRKEVGRRDDANTAVAIIQVDTSPPQAVLDQLAALPDMLMVRYAQLGDMAEVGEDHVDS